MRTAVATAAARVAARISRRLTGGGATSLPGVVGLRIQPKLIRDLRRGLAGSIVVTGTNGKTTTSRFIGETLRSAKRAYVHNQSGSNLLRGIAAVLAQAPRAGRRKPWGLFEVDEATMPAACAELAPKVVVVTNLFRDQLDRYGELRRTAAYLRQGLAALPKRSTVVLNADDPLVASLGKGLPQPVVYYGINDTTVSKPSLPHAADSITTPTGKLLRYDAIFTGHLGHYRSPDRSLRRPKPQVAAARINLDGLSGSDLTVRLGRRTLPVRLDLPGLYNAYNALAAVAAGHALGFPPAAIGPAIRRTAAAFGRQEEVEVDGRRIVITLIKNPTGTDEVIDTLRLEPGRKRFLVLINDNFADGTDVSWLWDADFERLLPQASSIAVGGTRAADMALRLKYAGLPEDEITSYADLPTALVRTVAATPRGERLYVLPTYTAMLELRRALARSGRVKHFLD